MKHKSILYAMFFFVVLLLPQVAMAYSFFETSPSGHKLYYSIVGNNAIVTYKEYGEGDTSMVGDIVIPSSAGGYNVIGIGSRAFYLCTGISSVTMPNTITRIDADAFAGCTGLTSVTIPENVTSLSNAFSGCTNLTTVYYNATNCTDTYMPFAEADFSGNYISSITTAIIGNNIQVIPDDLFGGCVQLTTVAIPPSVTTIGAAFWRCSNLTNINIPLSVTTIKEQAFQYSGLTSVSIPSSVNRIGYNAFAHCHNLTTVFYSMDSCIYNYQYGSSLYGGMFEDCENLSTVHLGSSVRYIPPYTFYGCTGLYSIDIPDGVRVIQNNTFGNCTGLHSVHLGNAVARIESKAFDGCSSLAAINFPRTLTHIGSEAFQNCSGLIYATFPDALKVINYKAFYGCSGLTDITIGSGDPLLSIEQQAFFNCDNITVIHSKAINPPVLSGTVFSAATNITVYIPCGTLAAYNSEWNHFSNIIETANIFMLTVESDDETMGHVEIIRQPTCQNFFAEIKATANDGYCFSHWQDGNTTNPRMVEMWHDTTLVAYFDVVSGIDNLSYEDFRIWSDNSQIHIRGAVGASVNIYDVIGYRFVANTTITDDEAVFHVDRSGVYIVKMDGRPIRKVVVTK